MAVTVHPPWDLAYDDEVDVLYASRGSPQPAASFEVMDDVLLRYLPPHTEVVGITVLNFLEHFPNIDAQPFQVHAIAVVEGLLSKYLVVAMP